MVARNTNVPFKGRIRMRKTNHLQIVTFGLQRAAGPYRRARSGHPDGLPPHGKDRHRHTFVYLFHPFSCLVLTLVQLSDGERFLYLRRLALTIAIVVLQRARVVFRICDQDHCSEE
jgi:hypothetical protein